MTAESVFTNGRIVLEDRILSGTVAVRDGRIASIDEGRSVAGIDLDGDYLIPGLVELHTDHLETHHTPRPAVHWPKLAAIQSYDGQIASCGITTVFDCLRLGSDEDGRFADNAMRDMAGALMSARADGRLKADHFIHLRCEVSSHDVIDQFETFGDVDIVRLASLMDHAPGQRQFQTMEQFTLYYKTMRGLSDEEFDAYVARRQAASATYSDRHRTTIAEAARGRGITLASHDDATQAHVDEAIALGVRLAEFPTSLAAADASHKAGLSVLMGAPNIVRGKSHSGNIAARDLAARGTLDVISSDYVPYSLIHAPFVLSEQVAGVSLPEAIAMVTATPARAVGLADRGRIAEGLRADLVRVRVADGVPIVRGVWRSGERIA
jgi:alpha-D-ribose 1-methylphosphonate 5-triphosphate diphosphatase